MEYKIDYFNYETKIPKNYIYTKAEYDCYINKKKVKYISNYISIIDIPYKRYKLK